MRVFLGIGLCALALLRAGPGLAATAADTGYANYAFASELGSGVSRFIDFVSMSSSASEGS